MASEWQEVALGEICDFRAGSVFKPKFQGKRYGDYPFVKVSDMNLPANAVRIQTANNWVSEADLKEIRAKPFPPGTVVFAKIGEALRQNRLRQIGRETIVDNNMMGAVPRLDQIDSRFFYYALSKFDFSSIAQGTALPYLTISSLSELILEIPPLSEQHAIANILVALDDRIDHNRALAANLETIARRLFKSWFVDFDPVRAKAAGEKPIGLADDIAALFPNRFAESELGEIPEGWRLETLASVARLNPEAWTTRKHPDEIHYLDLSNVKDGMIEAPTRYSWEEAPSRARRVLQQGDTIIGTVRPGNRSFALIDQVGLTGSTGFAVLRPASVEEREYLYLASTSDDAIERLAHLADGAAYPAVRPEVVLATEAVIPGEEVMTAFSSVTKGMLDRASVCKQEAKVLADIRDLLLPPLISGKIRVAEAESIIEEVIV